MSSQLLLPTLICIRNLIIKLAERPLNLLFVTNFINRKEIEKHVERHFAANLTNKIENSTRNHLKQCKGSICW